MIHKKLLSLLVLLMTAASGAWAEEQITITQGFEAGMGDWTTNNCDGGTGITDQSGSYEGSNIFCFYYSENPPQYLISPELDENDGGTMSFYYARYHSNYPETFKVGYSTTTNVPTAFTWGDEVTCTNTYNSAGYSNFTYDFPAGTKYVSIACTSNNQYYLFVDDIKIEYTAEAPTDVEVTTNAAEGETTFTQASFAMPTFDATVNYDIVRDMEDETYPVEFSGLAERVVVKKKTGSDAYEPLTELTIQLIDQLAATDAQNIIEADGIKVKVLKGTDNNGTITYNETNPLTLEEFTADMQPGLYKIVAEPTDATTSPYTGTASLAFETLAGFPVDVPAKEYVTYYSATDNLTLEENSGAQLYTITAVSGSTATAEEISGANKETPFLVYNSSDKDKTIILIPTDVVIAGQTHASEFVGTATATTIAASTDALNNYAFNGKKFIWVMEDLPVAANKAWLAIPATPSSARVINLVFGDATAIGAVSGSPADNGDIYDLNGRKLDKKPTRKGVYIQNGRKVVIK